MAEVVPRLLSIFFDVLIAYADENAVKLITQALFERMEQVRSNNIKHDLFIYLLTDTSYTQLYPYELFEQNVRKTLVQKMLAIFQKFPSFIISQKVRCQSFTSLCSHR